jgi:type I restriction enzyme R subunit
MQGHELMQAIARVNRVYLDEKGGLVVDYLGLAENLRRALATYTQAGGQGVTAEDIEQALAKFLEHLETARDFLHGLDYRVFMTGDRLERLLVLAPAMNHVLGKPDGRDRYVDW